MGVSIRCNHASSPQLYKLQRHPNVPYCFESAALRGMAKALHLPNASIKVRICWRFCSISWEWSSRRRNSVIAASAVGIAITPGGARCASAARRTTAKSLTRTAGSRLPLRCSTLGLAMNFLARQSPRAAPRKSRCSMHCRSRHSCSCRLRWHAH